MCGAPIELDRIQYGKEIAFDGFEFGAVWREAAAANRKRWRLEEQLRMDP